MSAPWYKSHEQKEAPFKLVIAFKILTFSLLLIPFELKIQNSILETWHSYSFRCCRRIESCHSICVIDRKLLHFLHAAYHYSYFFTKDLQKTSDVWTLHIIFAYMETFISTWILICVINRIYSNQEPCCLEDLAEEDCFLYATVVSASVIFWAIYIYKFYDVSFFSRNIVFSGITLMRTFLQHAGSCV